MEMLRFFVPLVKNGKALMNLIKILIEGRQLETLGGHCLLLCGLDGTLYQGASSVGERVMSAPGCNIIPLFSSYLQCKLRLQISYRIQIYPESGINLFGKLPLQ